MNDVMRVWLFGLVAAGVFVPGSLSMVTERKYKSPIYPVVRWTGNNADARLERKSPSTGLITSQKRLSELWKEWRPGESVPDVDFDKCFVVVATKTGQPAWLIGLFPFGNEGDSALGVMSDTRQPCAGFGYGIGVFDRDRIKLFHGKPVPKDKD